MHMPILPDIVIILGLSVLIILLFHKLKLPAILGFLLTGIITGPNGLNLIKASHEVELLSEIGIIFLLFVIGIEFSLKGLATIKNTVLIGGFMQVGLTIGLTALVARWFDMDWPSAVFLGFLFALSSTAIVLKMLQERGEITAAHGRVSIAILIFQDIIVVPMMLVAPLMAGVAENPWNTALWLLVKVAIIVLVVIAMARYLVPILFRMVVRSKSRELFILTVVVMCFATAWLTSSVGLSLALGAFFAGLIISESAYSHQATANILPFREIFISFFFVSIGMLLDLRFFIEHFVVIHLFAALAVTIKLAVIGLTVLVLRYPPRTILLTALSLFQVGEFAFLLSATGMQYDLLSQEVYQYFLAISIITMGGTPFVIQWAPRIADFLIKVPISGKVRSRLDARQKRKLELQQAEVQHLHDHIVIIGYGLNGENVAKAAREANIPYVIMELDPEAIKKGRKTDEPIVYGDASDEIILRHVHIHEARVVVIAISSPQTTKVIIETIRRFTETAYIIVRTRYIREIEENIRLGADEVIPEEFETSIEIFTRVLKKYLVPTDEIQAFVNKIRSHNYELLRSIPGLKKKLASLSMHIPDMEIATLHVVQGNNAIVGKTIGESELRTKYGITVLTIKRGNKYIKDIHPRVTIEQDDILYVFGSPDHILEANKMLKL
jgi:monovalent cation:H+ antiporter-2, CPA2 family